MLDNGFEIDKVQMKNFINDCTKKIKELSKIDSNAIFASGKGKSSLMMGKRK